MRRDSGKHQSGARRGAAVRLALLLAAAIVLAFLLRGLLSSRKEQPASPTAAVSTETVPSATPAPTAEPEPTPEPLPWYLVLVNRDNPVPEDWEVQPVTMPNGQIVDARIYAPLMEMFEAARAVNLDVLPLVESGYRSAQAQQAIYDSRVSDYKAQGWSDAGARIETEKWVALPGTSEHQLGIAADISGAVYAIYPWLEEHSWEYGFILRYPPDKTAVTGISGEEWHYRYVGKEAAAEIHERGLTLEEYLAELT